MRPVTPSPTRLTGYRRVERRRGLPLVMKAFLALSVVMLGGAILWAGSGQVGPFISSVVKGFGGFVSQVGVVAGSPKPTEAPALADAPSIAVPEQPYTNKDKVDVTVNVPPAVTGLEGYTVRLYVTLEDEDPQLLVEVPVGRIAVQVLPAVGLSTGRNDIQAAIMGPAGESERSAVATWVLDQSKPKVSVISPKNNAQVKKAVVTVKGKSQAGAEIRLTNAANGAIATTVVGKDNLWETTLAIADGSNAITVTATGPGRQREHGGAQRAEGLGPPHRQPDELGLPVQGVQAAQEHHAQRDRHGPRRPARSPARRPCSRSASRASRRSSPARCRRTRAAWRRSPRRSPPERRREAGSRRSS